MVSAVKFIFPFQHVSKTTLFPQEMIHRKGILLNRSEISQCTHSWEKHHGIFNECKWSRFQFCISSESLLLCWYSDLKYNSRVWVQHCLRRKNAFHRVTNIKSCNTSDPWRPPSQMLMRINPKNPYKCSILVSYSAILGASHTVFTDGTKLVIPATLQKGTVKEMEKLG